MIEIKNLTHNYKNAMAIDNLSLGVKTGMIGLLGENGAGKSTLMKIIATLEEVQNGAVTIKGIELKKNNYNKIRKIVGFMPQEFGFYDGFTVFEMLEYMCLLENVDKKDIRPRILGLLEELNLKGQIRKKTKELSGGMKRRLGLACAIINKPEILIVDEPTVGLDPEERIKMRNFLKKYSIGRMVLLSTHIVEDIRSICDEVIILSKGVNLFEGQVDDLIEQSPSVFELDCKIDKLDYYRKYGVITDINHRDDRCTIKIVTDQADFEYSNQVEKTLETAYMNILNKETMT